MLQLSTGTVHNMTSMSPLVTWCEHSVQGSQAVRAERNIPNVFSRRYYWRAVQTLTKSRIYIVNQVEACQKKC